MRIFQDTFSDSEHREQTGLPRVFEVRESTQIVAESPVHYGRLEKVEKLAAPR